jgi:hypothetical protein
MKTLLFAFVGCLVANFASAGGALSACVEPNEAAEQTLVTIETQASFDFGDLDVNACQKIVSKGVKLCKEQVKAAAKCWKKDTATVKDIAVKQCNQLESAKERAGCKDFFKSQKEGIDDEVDADKDESLEACEDGFADELAEACAVGVPS